MTGVQAAGDGRRIGWTSTVEQEPALRIAQVARATGTTPRALRYYEEIGLLSPGRPFGQARIYVADDLRAARDIVELRRLGFSVDEIATYLNYPSSDHPERRRLAEKLAERLRSIAGQQIFLRSALARLAERSGSNDD